MSVAILTKDQSFLLVTAGALLGLYSDVLSDFEVETVAEVSRRWLRTPEVAISTPSEFTVVEDSVAAMRAHARRPIVKAAA